MNSPFKFLDAYELQDKDAFFGRDTETDALYQLVTQNRLTFVYGPSGIGKTSLVQCGLASRFDRVDWLPLFVRRGDDLNASLRREIGKALGQDGPYAGDLNVAIDTLYKNYLRPVYLIFDQFEELFILGRDDDDEQERLPFYESIADLLDAHLPCRILFIMREDYFGHLNQFEQVIPELYHRKLRVEAMSRDNLQAVITGSCRVFGIGFDDARHSPQLIMDNILAGKKGVHMPYVQVYLHILYQESLLTLPVLPALPAEAEGVGGLRFTDAIIQKVGPITDVLGRFLQEQKALIFKKLQYLFAELSPGVGAEPPTPLSAEAAGVGGKAMPRLLREPAFATASAGKAVKEDTVSQVLDVFVSGEGTKVPVGYTQQADGTITLEAKAAKPLAALFSNHEGVSAAALVSATVLELEKSRILRRSDDTFELAHDTLAALIDQQRSVEQRQLRDLRQRIETGCREHADSGGVYFFDKGQLARIEPFLPKLVLEPEQAEFLEKSRVEGERLENAEKERVARELRLTEDKLAAEERARKRQAVFSRVIAAVAVLAMVGLAFAAWQYFQANSARQAAQVSEQKALHQTKLAVERDSLMQLARDTALLQKNVADQQTVAALLANQNTEKALLDLKITSDQAVTILLAEIDRNILRLEYDSTFRKCQTAVNLKAQRGAVEKRLWEIAYFYTEADTAAAAIAFLNLLQPTGLTVRTPGVGAKLRTILKGRIPPAYLASLEERYFPKTIPVEGGSFLRKKDSVRVNGFHIAETETTFWQYNVFAKATGHYIAPPSWQFAGDNPAVNVNWFDAAFYLNWLNERKGLKPVYKLTAKGESNYTVEIDDSAKSYRLPTEAEWEFAARGGNDSQGFEYSGDSVLTKVGWYYANSGSRTQAVRQKKANELGLYDMSGNVWEWCRDWLGSYDPAQNDNPVGPGEGSLRVVRGGSWLDFAEDCRAAFRNYDDPDRRDDRYGFRLVFVP